MKGPYCRGTGCPAAGHCERFKVSIDFSKDLYLAWVPYDPAEKKCEFFMGTRPGDVWQTIKNILNGKAKEDKGNVL